MSVSLAAYVKGFLEYKKDSHICGVIFNQMSPMLYPRMKKLLEGAFRKGAGICSEVEDCVSKPLSGAGASGGDPGAEKKSACTLLKY